MNEYFKEFGSIILFWLTVTSVVFIRYKFPHFGMHFTNGLKMFYFRDLDYKKKCKIHKKEDIEAYKNKQKYFLFLFLAIGIIIIFILPFLVL